MPLTNERDFPVPSDPRSCGVRHQSATMGGAISHQFTRFVEGEVHDSHCHDRNRSGQAHLCRSWCGCHRQARLGSAQCAAQQTARTHRLAAAVPDRHRSLPRRPPLGSRVPAQELESDSNFQIHHYDATVGRALGSDLRGLKFATASL